MPISSDADALSRATRGIGMRSFSPFTANVTISGGRWIRTATCWICSCNADRDTHAAKQCFCKLLEDCRYVSRVIITDRLNRDGAATRESLPGIEHRPHRDLNNRAENAHQPTRQRERPMQGCKSPRHAQRFLAAYGLIAQHVRPRRHRLSAPESRQEMGNRFRTSQDITSLPTTAYA
jgi:putative transposase